MPGVWLSIWATEYFSPDVVSHLLGIANGLVDSFYRAHELLVSQWQRSPFLKVFFKTDVPKRDLRWWRSILAPAHRRDG